MVFTSTRPIRPPAPATIKRMSDMAFVLRKPCGIAAPAAPGNSQGPDRPAPATIIRPLAVHRVPSMVALAIARRVVGFVPLVVLENVNAGP
jgi:hypothetical protein